MFNNIYVMNNWTFLFISRSFYPLNTERRSSSTTSSLTSLTKISLSTLVVSPSKATGSLTFSSFFTSSLMTSQSISWWWVKEKNHQNKSSSSFISSLISSSLKDSPQSTKLNWVIWIFVYSYISFFQYEQQFYYDEIVQIFVHMIFDIHHMSEVSLLCALFFVQLKFLNVKRPFTNITWIRFVPCVNSFMISQLNAHTESLFTNFTSIWLFTCMNSSMTS